MSQRAISATGRRKTASARVRITPVSEGEASIVVNGRDYEKYFPRATTQMVVRKPLEITERLGKYSFQITVTGGGFSGQVGAVRHGISRALETVEPELRSVLKKEGLLTRDPRAVERKKYGRHKARKRPQFSKR